MSFEKYRVHEVAKDFGKQTKDITQILTTYATTPKNHMQVLDDKELSIIFEYLTQHNQVADLQAVFANAPKAGEGAKNDRPRDNRDSGRKQGQQKRGEGEQIQPGRGPPGPERWPPEQRRGAPGKGRPPAGTAGQAGRQPPHHPGPREEAGGHPESGQRQPGPVRRAPGEPGAGAGQARCRAASRRFQSRDNQRKGGNLPATSAARRSRRRCAGSSWRSPRRPP